MTVLLLGGVFLVLGVVAGAGLTFVITAGQQKARAAELAREAERERERLLREVELDKKSRLLEVQQELESAQRTQRDELLEKEKVLRQRQGGLDRQQQDLSEREQQLKQEEAALSADSAALDKNRRQVSEQLDRAQVELERVSGLSKQQAHDELVKAVEVEARRAAASRVRQIEEEATREATARAQALVAAAIQRLAGGFVAEKTVSVVELPSDEMKGRIIGREGRNIRAIESVTGVDVIIDDTPEVVVVSAFNPIRRDIARLSLERLVADGRIHPARIEEVVEQVTAEMEQEVQRAGEQAALDLGLHGLHPELLKLVGKLRWRSAGSQNLWNHAMETALISGLLAEELGADATSAKRAGLLHDVGKAVDHEVPGPHGEIGAEQARRYGERPEVVAAIRQYHDASPPSLLGVILQVADSLSKQRPGARREQYETYIKRLEALERLSLTFKGVERAYAIQAGREVRVIVNYEQVSEDEAVLLSGDIARRIQDTLTYPGEVRVTVIREARATDIAR